MKVHTITPFLWFDNQAAEAAKFYCSVFTNSKLITNVDYDNALTGERAAVNAVTFEINGLRLTAFNGGPMFKFTEAVSLYVDCETQEDVDYYWDKFISNGGTESQCGWLKDKFGLSWQIVPAILLRLLSDPDSARSGRAMQAMLKMNKIIVADLEAAARG
jgi:predicted 3-demethylubiquinone-9 3-methyltransferase (glyoxalase superfamily)